MGKCDNCGKEWHDIKSEDDDTFCLGCGNDRPSKEFEYDCLIDSMNPEERAAIIDKYYDF